MKYLGEVRRVLKLNLWVAQVDSAPREGTKVFDKRMLPIGVVEDVFGPVDSPYAVIRTQGETSALKAQGTKLYVR